MHVDVVVKQSRNHVVGRRDRVEVAREVEVNLLHREHLGVATTSGTALHTEARAQRGLTQGAYGILAQLVQSQCQANAHCCLANASLGRGDGRYKDEVALLNFLFVNELVGHFGDVFAIVFKGI